MNRKNKDRKNLDRVGYFFIGYVFATDPKVHIKCLIVENDDEK